MDLILLDNTVQHFSKSLQKNSINVKDVFYTITKEIYESIKDKERYQDSLLMSRNTLTRSTVLNSLNDNPKEKQKNCKW